jgi:hypothetical protein
MKCMVPVRVATGKENGLNRPENLSTFAPIAVELGRWHGNLTFICLLGDNDFGGMGAGGGGWRCPSVNASLNSYAGFRRRRMPERVMKRCSRSRASLDAVEDEMTGIDNNPENWHFDGRIYPPQLDSMYAVPSHPGVKRFRSLGHNTYIGVNGSVEVVSLHGTVELRKPGLDGRNVWELE